MQELRISLSIQEPPFLIAEPQLIENRDNLLFQNGSKFSFFLFSILNIH